MKKESYSKKQKLEILSKVLKRATRFYEDSVRAKEAKEAILELGSLNQN
jgi:hypothetical protein